MVLASGAGSCSWASAHMAGHRHWHRTSNEAQPRGQDVGGLGLDEDLAAVQRDTGAQLPAHVKHGWFLEARKGQRQVAKAEIRGSPARRQSLHGHGEPLPKATWAGRFEADVRCPACVCLFKSPEGPGEAPPTMAPGGVGGPLWAAAALPIKTMTYMSLRTEPSLLGIRGQQTRAHRPNHLFV